MGPALSQLQTSMANSFKEVLKERQRDMVKHIDDELRPIKEDVSRILVTITSLQQQAMANPGQEKVSFPVDVLC